jgi:hypothetical protein
MVQEERDVNERQVALRAFRAIGTSTVKQVDE